MISFLSLSLGFLQPGFHIIAFLADLSETKGRSGNLVYVHSQWVNFALSLGKRGAGSCPLCVSVRMSSVMLIVAEAFHPLLFKGLN